MRKKLQRTGQGVAVKLAQGETLHGFYYVTREVETSHGAQSIHDFILISRFGNMEPGEKASIWGSLVLDDLISSAAQWAETWVTFCGIDGSTKIFEVEQDIDNKYRDRQSPNTKSTTPF